MEDNSKDNLVIFGSNVKKFRISNKYTQEKLAEIIGISAVQIGRIESGKNACTIQILLKLCCALKCTPNELFKNVKEVPLKNSSSNILSKYLNELESSDAEAKELLKYIINYFDKK